MRTRSGNINPVLIIILILMVAERFLYSGQSISSWLYETLLMLPGMVVGLTFHEAAHGLVSHLMGDPTPKMQGRLTLNPLKHIEPVGFIALLVAGFGWGRPVEIDPRYYKHRRLGEFLVSIAGVVTNFLIAFIVSIIIKVMLHYMSYTFYVNVGSIIIQILLYMFMINIVLMVFNLLPVPPLDGFGILTQIFNLRKYSWYYPLYRNGFLILMILIIFNITSLVINPCYSFFYRLLLL